MQIKVKIRPAFFWLIHPGALALYVFLILYFSLPDFFPKYKAELINSQASNLQHILYSDLNNNGHEEKIITAYNGNKVPKFLLHNHKDQIINQWNFKGVFLEYRDEIIGDYDKNQLKEVYFLTINHDSLLLNVLEPFAEKEFVVNNRFISKVGLHHDEPYITFTNGKLIDTNDDGFLDFVFVIYAGYSLYPRSVFVYDIKNDKLKQSPESASGISVKAAFLDLNHDGIEEVCGKVTAHENIHFPKSYSDSSSWLMVFNLNNKPDFLFPPIEFKTGIGSEIYTIPYLFKNQGYLATTFLNRNATSLGQSLMLKIYNTKGELIKEKAYSIEKYGILTFINPNIKSSNYFYLHDKWGNIYKTDTSLALKLHSSPKENDLTIHSYINSSIDINKDGKNETIFIGEGKQMGLLIYNNQLTNPTFLAIPSLNYSSNWRISTKKSDYINSSNLIINSNNRRVEILYKTNPYYLWKYPVYLLSYSFLIIIFWLLQLAQKSVVARCYETEKQLMQQQMAISKKQMEPHFMLNMINNIGYMFTREDKQNVLFYLGKFGSLMRKGLNNSRKVQISLEEELEFVEDYLILQKKLMDDELDFQIKIEEGVEEELILIPHSLVYTFVENAIKHGLKPKEKDRKLEVRVQNINTQTKITIQDNGIGRQKSKELNTADTGKGMEIVQTIIKGYNQLHGGKIRYSVEDVLGHDGDAVGTQVEVWV